MKHLSFLLLYFVSLLLFFFVGNYLLVYTFAVCASNHGLY